MTPEQMLAEAMLKSARADLARAQLAWEASSVSPEAVHLLALAVSAEEDAHKACMAAMTAGLAAEISEVVPDAFPEASGE